MLFLSESFFGLKKLAWKVEEESGKTEERKD
jgi:hypothetical protein